MYKDELEKVARIPIAPSKELVESIGKHFNYCLPSTAEINNLLREKDLHIFDAILDNDYKKLYLEAGKCILFYFIC